MNPRKLEYHQKYGVRHLSNTDAPRKGSKSEVAKLEKVAKAARVRVESGARRVIGPPERIRISDRQSH